MLDGCGIAFKGRTTATSGNVDEAQPVSESYGGNAIILKPAPY